MLKKRLFATVLGLLIVVSIPFLVPEIMGLFSDDYILITDEEGKKKFFKKEEMIASSVLSIVGTGANEEEIKAVSVIVETAIKRGNFVPNFSSGYLIGTGEKEEIKRIEDIISEVKGQFLIYENQPIVASFHKSSGGKTIKNPEYPYLASVISDKVISFQNIKKEGFESVKVNKTDEDGVVLEVLIDETAISGDEFRKRFSIKSKVFTVNDNGQDIRITNYGIGHQEGLSLTGAKKMAEEGKNYKEILAYYYKGVSIVVG